MTSNRPYLMRAIYEWILDNDMTPHVLIDADLPTVEVPRQYVEEGRIVLNISPGAVQQFAIDNDCLGFSARFGGKPFSIYAPINAVRAIYAAENSEGMMFELLPTSDSDEEVTGSDDPEPTPPPKRPSLRVVK
ncbi:ClpXP protease specificity-enhancing factor [Leucothrix arctica]|uniref:ClpXP protease specificity-enhancing factor n=2 Tax=Leucothrix arctica TaxID=1481894 RepID=A0A317CLF3_9GAMM|nr:ClpXP protease specificity-enhancing factor [Leucothrix arctica]